MNLVSGLDCNNFRIRSHQLFDRIPLIFQTKTSARFNSQHLKYQRFTPSSCKDIGMRNLEFVANVHFRIYPN